MKRKALALILTSAVIVAGTAGFLIWGGPGPGSSTEDPTETSQTALPPPNPYAHHFFMGSVNRGDSRKLQGKILVTFILVSDSQNRWDAASVQKLKTVHKNAANTMKLEAASYGVTLEVSHKYIMCTIKSVFSREEYAASVRRVLDEAGYSDRISRKLEEENGVDDAPILFCINRSDRSFAVTSRDVFGFEYGVLYGNTEDYRHELYHLYGAVDLYPKSVKTLGEKYFPTSVMLQSSMVADDLTAYLIGWTDTLSEKAVAFLEATKHIHSGNFKDETD